MHRVRDVTSGMRLIIAVVCILFLVMPGVVFAGTLNTTTPGVEVTTGIVPNITSVPATPLPTAPPVSGNTTGIVTNVTPLPTTPAPLVFVYLENATDAVNPPPLLIFDTPLIDNLTCTIYGIVEPGSGNVTVVSTLWNWGDSQTPEYHGFPNSHVYSSPGTYTLTITARQSDGQKVTATTKISVGQPLIPATVPATPVTTAPGGPVMVVHAPLLTLLEPAIDRMNVTLNGNLNAGSPGVTIESVTVDWNDGSITKSSDLPIAHRYSGAGIFTVSVTGNQSDGQQTTKKIALEIKKEIPTLPEPTPSGSPQNDLQAYLIIIAMAITGVVIVTVVLITQRRKEPLGAKDTKKAFPARASPLSENLPSPEELSAICSGTDVTPGVLDSVIQVAGEIAREGREGQAIGTAFVVGDTKNVLHYSKQFVLNPFHGHQETERQITDGGIKGTIKEFAQLDGAFLITGTGVVEAAGRCITVDMSQVNLPGGMGSRHSSVAGITQVTKSIGIVVSQSGGQIRIFREGKIVYRIRS